MSTKKITDSDKDLWMIIFSELVLRNPEIQRLEHEWTKNPGDDDKYQALIARQREIWGDVFSYRMFPVLDLCQADIDRLHRQDKKEPYELLLSIDLRYSMEELEQMVHQYIAKAHKEYRMTAQNKYLRRNFHNWIRYLQVYDLRKGRTSFNMFASGLIPVKENSMIMNISDRVYEFRPFTVDMIAKYVHSKMIDPQDPKSNRKAYLRTVKDYRSALLLINGRDPEHRGRLTKKEPEPPKGANLKEWESYLDDVEGRVTVDRSPCLESRLLHNKLYSY